MKKRVISVLCAVLILALTYTSVFAGTSSFGKGYGFEYGIDKISTEHRSTMGAAFPDLVGTEIDGSVVGESDYVILNTVTDDEMNKYTGYGNGLRNVYVWKQNTDGSVSKLYGGTGTYAGYEGYAIHRDGVTYALGDGVKTTPKIYSTNTQVAGSTTGGTWVIKPGTTNCKVTLGKYDVNMNGISEFTVKLSRWSADWNNTPRFFVYLVQGENAGKEDAPSEYSFKQLELLHTERGGQLYMPDTGTQAAKLTFEDFRKADKYITATAVVDSVSETPRAMVKVTDSNGKVYESKWFSLAGADFDFTKDMGIKMLVQEYVNTTSEIHLGDISFKKTIDIADTVYKAPVTVINNGFDALGGVVIGALYDADSNKLISMKTAEVENIESEGSITKAFELDNPDKIKNVKAKFFFWSDLQDGFEPLGAQDLNAAAPTIICE